MSLEAIRFGLAPKLAAFTLLLMVAVGGSLSWRATRALKRTKVVELESKGEAIATAIAFSVACERERARNLPAVQGYLQAAKTIAGVRYIYIQDRDGSILAHTFAPSFPPFFEEVNALKAGETRVRISEPMEVELQGGKVRIIDVAAPLERGDQGVVHVGMDRSLIDREIDALGRDLMLSAALICLVAIAFTLSIAFVTVLRPLRRLTDQTGQSLRRVIVQLTETGKVVSSGSETVRNQVVETADATRRSLRSLTEVAQRIDVLQANAEAGSSTVTQMSATTERADQCVLAMTQSVETTHVAIDRMVSGIKQIAGRVVTLDAALHETSTSISEMNASIGQIKAGAGDTALLAEKVAEEAQVGAAALGSTIDGIRHIEESSRAAGQEIETLGQDIVDISRMTDVIGGVAEQINMLGLNASIIAAHAGESGRGFTVVVGEIKTLAERTRDYTREIQAIIGKVRQQSRRAAAAISSTQESIGEGVQRGQAANRVFANISASAASCTARVKQMADATAEQFKGTARLNLSVHQIADAARDMSDVCRVQAQSGEGVLESTQALIGIAHELALASAEQAAGSRVLTGSIAQIARLVGQLNEAQREQASRSGLILEAVSSVRSVADGQATSVRRLDDALASLEQQANALNRSMAQLRL